MTARSSLPEERKRMFLSKIIKIQDNEESDFRSFSLKQFPCDDENSRKKHRRAAEALAKKHADAAHDIRTQAQQEAHQIISTAHTQAQKIKQDASAQGFSQGEQAARQKIEQELAPLVSTLRSIDAEFENIKGTFYDDHQDIILELALKIARKVIHQEISSNDELIISVLTSAIKLAIDREKLKIRIHPDDLEMCMQKRQDIMRRVDGIKQILFEPDGSINKGGAIIECAFGEIDARIEQQFDEIERELRTVHLDEETMTQ